MTDRPASVAAPPRATPSWTGRACAGLAGTCLVSLALAWTACVACRSSSAPTASGSAPSGSAQTASGSAHTASGSAGPSGAGSDAALAAASASRGPGPRAIRLEVRGRPRTAYVVPAKSGAGPFRIVVGFHGRDGNGAGAARTFALERGLEVPFVGLYPDGRAQGWLEGAVGWDTRDETSEDLAFFDALVAWATTSLAADPGRIDVVGFSWGAAMASLTACTRAGPVRAVVAVAGGGPAVPCVGAVSALVMHGAKDELEPRATSEASVEAWAFAAGCGATERPMFGDACRAREDCAGGHEVVRCEHGFGHEWPELLRGPVLGEFLRARR